MHADVFNFKENLATGRDTRIVQVFQNLVLGIDRDSFPIGEILEIDAVSAAPEAQLDSVVDEALGFHPFANPHFCEQVNGSLFQNASPDALLGILAAAIFDHYGIDSLQIQKVRQYETGGSGPDNSDLGSQ